MRPPLVLLLVAAACGSKQDGGAGDAKRTVAEVKPQPPPGGGPKIVVPPPPIEPPTDAECDQAIGNMKTFMGDDVPGDAEDKSQCMGLPRPVVRCLQTARSEADVDKCVDSYAAAHAGTPPAPVPPEQRATEADCRAAMANVKRLVPDMTGDPAQLVKDCAAMASAVEVTCLRDAKSKDDLDRCEGLGD